MEQEEGTLTSDPGVFTFPSCNVTVTVRGTEFCTIAITFPGGVPFTIACSQSYALSRALSESLGK